MIAIVTVVLAFPLGFLLRSRLAAMLAYVAAYLWAFTFQTLYLLLDSMGNPETGAFGASEFPLSYGLVTLAVFAAGLGLVTLAHGLRRRRQSAV
jgi:uncharacterized membrane protein